MCTVAVAGIITVGIGVLRLLPVVVFVVVQAHKIRSPRRVVVVRGLALFLPGIWVAF